MPAQERKFDFCFVNGPAELERFVNTTSAARSFVFHAESGTERYARLIHVAANGVAFTLPLDQATLCDGLRREFLLVRLRSLFNSSSHLKITYDLKRALRALADWHVPVAAPARDIMLATQLLRPLEPLPVLPENDAGDALRFMDFHHERLLSEREPALAERVLHEIEMPLVPVLSDMERRGIFLEEWSFAELMDGFTTKTGHEDSLRELQPLIDPRTRRLHVSFRQLGNVTGRLTPTPSSWVEWHPRSAVGRELRRSVRVMHDDHILISADYLHLEYKLTALLASAAGRNASWVRTVNDSSYAVSWFGRRCPAKGHAEHLAVLATAADVVKLAMIRTSHQLAGHGFTTRLVFQTGDELLFEGPASELEEAAAVIHDEMAGILESELGPRGRLAVELGAGRSWLDSRLA